jgi:hypothetical protein
MRSSAGKWLAILGVAGLFVGAPRPANAQVLVQVIGGMTKTAETKPVFAGAIGGKAGPVELGVEVGHFDTIAPKTIFDATLAASGGKVDADLPAWYGMGNLKFIAKSGAVQPFVQVGAGAARLHPMLDGSAPNVTLSSQFGESGDTTKFLAAAGAGLRLKVQKVIVEGGYRFIRVFTNFEPNSNFKDDKVLVNAHMFYVSLGLHF